MQLGKIAPKILIACILSSIATTGISLALDLILPHNLRVPFDYARLILAFVASVAFSVIMIYLLKIFDGSGESKVWEEYPDRYVGIIRDIPRIIKNERLELLSILAIGALNAILWMINKNLLGNSALSWAVNFLIAANPLALVLDGALGFLLGPIASCAVYCLTLGVFRWKWRRFM